MKIQTLKSLLPVEEVGSLSAAATSLHISDLLLPWLSAA